MRIVSYRRDDGAERFGVVDGEFVRDAGVDLTRLAPEASVGRLDELTVLAPVPRPGKVVCVGRNYAEHAAETGSPVPERPQLFAKWANAVVGPGVDVVHHAVTAQLDYEAELVAVIGRRAHRVPEAKALDVVLGYSCGDDVSARDLQFGDTQWVRGKTLDTFAPTGPWLVTADEIADPQALPIRCEVNGEVRQDDTTERLIWDFPELIRYITMFTTLKAGDVILTGTPTGSGSHADPPVWLKPGDVLEIEVPEIGILRNSVVDEP